MLLLVAIVSHSAADAGYVLVIPIGGVMFYAAGRHPLAGIAAAFAGVSGGFSANFIPSGIDPLLSGLTETAACDRCRAGGESVVQHLLHRCVFVLIIAVGWFLTDVIVEPRLRATNWTGMWMRCRRWNRCLRATDRICGAVWCRCWSLLCCWRVGLACGFRTAIRRRLADIVQTSGALDGSHCAADLSGVCAARNRARLRVGQIQITPGRDPRDDPVDGNHGILPGPGLFRRPVHRGISRLEYRRSDGPQGGRDF